MSEKKTFEECLPVITKVIDLYRSRWTLTCYAWEDLRQDILKHIFKKWHLYDSSRKLEPWVASITQSQIKNELRNKYYIYQPPCLKCEMFLGENQCKLYGEVSKKCALYKKFINQKAEASNLYFPVSYEQSNYDAAQQFSCAPQEFVGSIYLCISGVDNQIFKLFYESGFSTTKIARSINVSGFDFKERFTLVEDSLNKTYEIAKDILEDKKISMGI